MVSIIEAEKVIKRELPEGKVVDRAPYKNLFIFVVDVPSEGEEMMDPYYSVNKETGEFKEFSVTKDINPLELVGLFTEGES